MYGLTTKALSRIGRRLIGVIVGMLLALTLICALSPGLQAAAGRWVEMSGGILSELEKNHPVSDDIYTRATAGVSVDRKTGDVYLLANNIGICKSSDQGKSFTLVSGNAVTGRFETGWGLNIDPSGGRLMCFTIYGSAASSDDAGKTWKTSTMGHLDYGVVDWSDTGKTMLAIGHESGGKLLRTEDGGSKWQSVGTGFWAVGLFDRRTMVVGVENAPGILRRVDGSQAWTKVSDEPLAAPVMVEFKGVGYWLGEHGLLESKDKGASWSLVGATPDGASLGPMFGADARHMVVGSPNGLFESKDGGKTWSKAAPLAPEITVLKRGQYATYGWDPIHNIFYASQMMKPAYRFVASSG
ncbi:hypothetical protein BH11ARM1_BH11ARM1_02750 [soil metagenome]